MEEPEEVSSGGIIFLPRELFKDFEQNALVEVELLIRKK